MVCKAFQENSSNGGVVISRPYTESNGSQNDTKIRRWTIYERTQVRESSFADVIDIVLKPGMSGPEQTSESVINGAIWYDESLSTILYREQDH